MSLLSDYAAFLSNGGLLPYFAQGANYLAGLLLGDPPATTPQSPSYTPPFTGGQCSFNYAVHISTKQGGAYQDPFTVNLQGAIGAPVHNGGNSWSIPYANGTFDVTSQDTPILTVSPNPSQADNCGDVPNPNPAKPISDGGTPNANAPNISGNGQPIITGNPTPDDGSQGVSNTGKQNFSDAGALAPTDAAGALAKVAAGLIKVLEYLELLKKIIDLLNKLLDKGNKTSLRYDFGNLHNDGFVRLLPEPPDTDLQCIYLDLIATEIKPARGKVFGSLSPNYFKYEPLGRVEFVSRTFGILETHDVSFQRVSLAVPELAYGFYYHFGLDGVIKFNASGFYLKTEK